MVMAALKASGEPFGNRGKRLMAGQSGNSAKDWFRARNDARFSTDKGF
jgi:hypothetical protein